MERCTRSRCTSVCSVVVSARFMGGSLVAKRAYFGTLSPPRRSSSRCLIIVPENPEGPLHDRLLDIATPSGAMETFISPPSEGGPFPPVILYMDMWGVREELYDMARRISTVGYYVMVPDLYCRFGKYRNSFKDANGRMMSFTALPPDAQEK